MERDPRFFAIALFISARLSPPRSACFCRLHREKKDPERSTACGHIPAGVAGGGEGGAKEGEQVDPHPKY